MNSVKSAHTAGKYLETAINRGLIEEQNNPSDARSKLVGLSSHCKSSSMLFSTPRFKR